MAVDERVVARDDVPPASSRAPGGRSGAVQEATVLLVGLGLLVVVGLVSLFVGVSSLHPMDLVRGDEDQLRVFFVSRVPRLAAILLAGSAMGVAGLIMQSLVRNRFVAPSTAGTVEAAGLGILCATLWFGSASVMAKMSIAVVFALAGTALFLALVQRLRFADVLVVPLAGIMFGSVIQAVTTFFAFRFGLLQSLNAWTSGNFSATLQGRYELLYLVGGLTVVAYMFANRFTLAGMGRDFAVNLGVPYERVLYGGLALVATVTAVVVSVVGAIPFLGLVVPNIVTMVMGDNLRRVLPATAVGGALFVLVCDIVSRTIRYPYEIPVGTVVGVVGGVIFVFLLLRSRSDGR